MFDRLLNSYQSRIESTTHTVVGAAMQGNFGIFWFGDVADVDTADTTSGNLRGAKIIKHPSPVRDYPYAVPKISNAPYAVPFSTRTPFQKI